MNIRFLESFVAVADFGSIAEAARRLNITPATLAQRLRSLEADFGHALVDRNGRTVRPTAAGLAVLPHARELIRSANDLKVVAANNMPIGQLHLGSTATALTGILPAIISQLSARYSSIEYFVRPGASIDLYHEVLARQLDAAIIVRPQFPIPKSLGWMTLREEPLMLIAPANHPPDHPHEILARQRFIRYDRNQWGGQLVDDYLRMHRIKVREWLELDALDAIAALVSMGLGVAVVPDWAPPWPEGLCLQKIALPVAPIRETGLVWNRSGLKIAAIEALGRVCRELTGDTSPNTVESL